MQELIEQFAAQNNLDPETVEERWAGSPKQIAEDIFRVMDVDTGEYRDLTLFDPAQTKVLDAYFYSDSRTISLYKGRRIGYSFVVVLAFLLDGMMNPNSFYPVVGIKEEGAQARIKDISNLIKHAKVEIPVTKDNAGDVILWNGSHFKAYSGAPDSSRGDKSAKSVLLDEQAFYEDQETVSRAYRAFLSLGKNRKMMQVSTPYLSNDLFMRTHRKGTPDGSNGTLSIKQPSFHNADEIDIERSLFDQRVYPVRPDFDLQTVEEERSKDPAGFAQEYLCRPIDDSYSFFHPGSVRRAMERAWSVPVGGQVVMGVDIGISSDDTVAAIVKHYQDKRFMLALDVVTNEKLRGIGIENPDRGNANHIAYYLDELYQKYGVDTVVLDRTGPGETFQLIIEEKFGRSIRGFNFSAKDKVEDMMGDLNNALRNDRIQLIDDDRLYEEVTSIIKKKTREGAKPSFSGKDTSDTGKDDTAWATALASFPPGMAVQAGQRPRQSVPNRNETPTQGEIPRISAEKPTAKPATAVFGSVSTRRKRRRDTTYQKRYTR